MSLKDDANPAMEEVSNTVNTTQCAISIQEMPTLDDDNTTSQSSDQILQNKAESHCPPSSMSTASLDENLLKEVAAVKTSVYEQPIKVDQRFEGVTANTESIIGEEVCPEMADDRDEEMVTEDRKSIEAHDSILNLQPKVIVTDIGNQVSQMLEHSMDEVSLSLQSNIRIGENVAESTPPITSTEVEDIAPPSDFPVMESVVGLPENVKPILSHHLIGQSQTFGSGNYCKGCKWSPDGLCFLTNTNDNNVRIINTPVECLKCEWPVGDSVMSLEPCLKIQEPETVYDYCWWPLMNSQNPATCCFVTTSRDQPVHLWDAFDGSLRATYIAYNSVHEVHAAHSICFSSDGQQLLCGFKKEVCLFYTDHPGSDCEKWPTFKKKQRKSQNNIISCMEFAPDDSVFACGSYDGTIGIYSPANGHLLDFTVGHNAGITHLKFSNDGNRLYTGARKSGLLKCWDLRNIEQPIYELRRDVATNQRIYFDLVNRTGMNCETLVVSGSTDGSILFWDVRNLTGKDSDISDWKTTSRLELLYSYEAHSDCVNGCSSHPYLPLIVTSSGQRSFPEPLESDDESDALFSTQLTEENNIKLWRIKSNPECTQTSI